MSRMNFEEAYSGQNNLGQNNTILAHFLTNSDMAPKL
jgi:hypothetical protein